MNSYVLYAGIFIIIKGLAYQGPPGRIQLKESFRSRTKFQDLQFCSAIADKIVFSRTHLLFTGIVSFKSSFRIHKDDVILEVSTMYLLI